MPGGFSGVQGAPKGGPQKPCASLNPTRISLPSGLVAIAVSDRPRRPFGNACCAALSRTLGPTRGGEPVPVGLPGPSDFGPFDPMCLGAVMKFGFFSPLPWPQAGLPSRDKPNMDRTRHKMQNGFRQLEWFTVRTSFEDGLLSEDARPSSQYLQMVICRCARNRSECTDKSEPGRFSRRTT
jgi:hypothetical protein